MKLYIEKRLELLALNSGERLATFISQSVHRIAGIALLGLGGMFALIGLSIYLGEVLGYPWLGFLIVAAPPLFVGLFFVNLRPKSVNRNMRKRLMERMVHALLDELENTDKDSEPLDARQANNSSVSTETSKQFTKERS